MKSKESTSKQESSSSKKSNEASPSSYYVPHKDNDKFASPERKFQTKDENSPRSPYKYQKPNNGVQVSTRTAASSSSSKSSTSSHLSSKSPTPKSPSQHINDRSDLNYPYSSTSKVQPQINLILNEVTFRKQT